MSKKSVFLLLFLISNSLVFSAGGMPPDSIPSFLGKVNTMLHGVAAVAVITAIIVTGFKTMYNKESIRDCSGWIMGAGLVAAASEIGAMLI